MGNGMGWDGMGMGVTVVVAYGVEYLADFFFAHDCGG